MLESMFNGVMPFFLVVFAAILLKYLCNSFEQPAAYLGRRLPPGVKGSTINAVGSSMPEMCVVIACLFFFNDPQLVLVGLGVTAGSAIFNGCVIPAISILVARDAYGNPVESISLDKKALARDVFWVLLAEVALIYCLGFTAFNVTMAVALNLIYIGYGIHLYWDTRKANIEGEDYEYEEIEDLGFVRNVLTFNFNALLFKNKEFTTGRALVVLGLAIAGITIASHLLVEGVLGASDVLGVPAFFSGLVLGSAASSIPDLILSMQDARKGEFEDAVANPLASNTFDTTIAFALPMLVWFLWHGETELPLVQDEGLDFLRWSIVAVTISVASALLFKHTNVTKKVAWFLLGVFATWLGSVVLFLS